MSRWRRQQRKRARRAREWVARLDKWIAESEALFEDIRRDLKLLSLAERMRRLADQYDSPEAQRMVTRVVAELVGRPRAAYEAETRVLTATAPERPLRTGIVTSSMPSSLSGTVPWR